ncbi:MAG: FHA domain-containing protein, partial [Deltaproteobacteria bacterium]
RGEVFLYDPWSEQGTYLDGARITKKTPLTDGAKITFGKVPCRIFLKQG